MPEKSPQKRSVKKEGRSIKEKRAEKKVKAEDAPIGFKAAARKPRAS